MESTVNQPHPDSPQDEAEEFFGPPDQDDPPTGANGDPGPFESPDFAPGESEPDPRPEPTLEPSGTEPSPPDQEPDEEPDDEEPEEPEGARRVPTVPAAAEPAPQKQRGSITRQYIVFHRLALTRRVLEHLLSELDKPDRGGEPRYAFFELHRVDARNANEAVSAGYKQHKDRIGETADMAAVSRKAFQTRHVEPMVQRVTTKISAL